MKTIQIHYEGRVQGVGFRWTVKSLAREYDVCGTIRNLPDGRVEMVAQGDDAEIENFIEAINTSALASHIKTQIAEDLPHATRFSGFQITR